MEISFTEFLKLKKSLKKNTIVKILSNSMEPFIYKDDHVRVSPIKNSKLKAGTPIVFWKNNILICHFYIIKNKIGERELIYTKGINNSKFDEPLDPNFILGEVTSPKISRFKRGLFALYYRLYFLLK